MQYIALDFKKTKNKLTRVTALVKIQVTTIFNITTVFP